MPTNLPPQYYVAEQKYRAARGPAEKVAALQQMLAATPKHKGTDHLRADMRARVARGLEELEQPPQRGAIGRGTIRPPFPSRRGSCNDRTSCPCHWTHRMFTGRSLGSSSGISNGLYTMRRPNCASRSSNLRSTAVSVVLVPIPQSH